MSNKNLKEVIRIFKEAQDREVETPTGGTMRLRQMPPIHQIIIMGEFFVDLISAKQKADLNSYNDNNDKEVHNEGHNTVDGDEPSTGVEGEHGSGAGHESGIDASVQQDGVQVDGKGSKQKKSKAKGSKGLS